MNTKKGSGAAGKLLTGALLLLSAAVLGLLYYTEIIPIKYLAIAGAVLLIFVVIVGILTWNFYHKGRFLIGLLLWFVLIVVLVLGALYLYKTRSTLSDITGVDREIAQVGIYVKSETEAETLEDTKGFAYGILSDLDRANTDLTVAEISEQLGLEIMTKEYSGLGDLVDSLMRGETQAIIVNTAFLDIVREMDGYASLDSMIRSVNTSTVETQIEQKTETEADPQKATSGRDRSVYVIYISGIDNRGGIVSKSRSDVNIIMVANTDTRQMLLLNTPRDYFVPLSISNGVPDKLTHAGIYGISVCMDTLGMLYDIDINYYVRMNFGGFVEIIDALGGVSVDSDYEFDSQNILGYHFNEGENYMNGEEALVFARERFSFEEGDRQRGKNQIAVIEGVIKKAASKDLLSNYSSLLSSLSGSFETNISYEEIARVLQKQLNNISSWNVVSYSVNGEEDLQKPYSMSQEAYVMIPDQATVDHARELIQEVINGETITG